MPTPLPSAAAFTGSGVTEADFKTALTNLRTYLASLLGEDGEATTALAALGGLGGAILQKSSAYTVSTADRGAVIGATGTFALTLPLASGAGAGWLVAVRNDGSGTVTLTRSGSDTIDGSATRTIAPGHGGLLVSTGTEWITVGVLGSGRLYLADGSAGAPSLVLAGDTDSGIFNAGSALGFAVGGTQRVKMGTAAITVDVPLQGTAVQSSATDTTAGRLARIFQDGGIFGLGMAADRSLGSALGDADNATVSGPYVTDGSTTNLPGGGGAGLLDVANGTGAGTVFQTWRANAADGRWHRRKVSGTWEPWVSDYHLASIVGTVSYSGSTPNGAILEAGSNANGYYERLANGTQRCWRIDATFVYSNAGQLAISGGAWTFPATFAVSPRLSPATYSTVSGDLTDVTVAELGNLRHGTNGASQSVLIEKAYGAPSFAGTAEVRNVRLEATGFWRAP